MTETTVTMCDALEASPLSEGQQLACFLRPHPEDPWHYDNRGLGVWFRPVPGGIDARVGLTVHPDEAPAEEERDDAADASNLPMLFATAGQLDVDRLRELAPVIRRGLVAALRSSATELRRGRGTVVVPEDTFDLVRRVVAAAEVLRQWRDAFEAAAKDADAIAEEEALTANGGLPGYEEAPSGSLFVPDGPGRRIAVTPDWKPGDSTWDLGTLIGWVVEQEVENYGVNLEEDEGGWSEQHAKNAAREAVLRLLDLGTFTPGVKKLDALRKKLSEQQRDSDAAVIRQVRTVGLRQYKGVKITREDTK